MIKLRVGYKTKKNGDLSKIEQNAKIFTPYQTILKKKKSTSLQREIAKSTPRLIDHTRVNKRFCTQSK